MLKASKGFLWAELFNIPFQRFFLSTLFRVWFFCVVFSGWVLMVFGCLGMLVCGFFHVDVCRGLAVMAWGFIPDRFDLSRLVLLRCVQCNVAP